ncbi:helix-turn-helix domain-containing protein [Bacillus sp. S13(2024)]|uniref:helix-turn-helix domain-containing protein n=1 Tax=Bacillus sp. S13(2024) TaxID=3162885 RepID=UPI003D252761
MIKCLNNHSKSNFYIEGAYMGIGDLIKNKRLEKKKSVQYIATKLEIPNSYIQKIEDGKIDPTFGTVKRILKVLDSNLEDLFSIEPKETIKEVEVIKKIEVIKEPPKCKEKDVVIANEEFVNKVINKLEKYIEISNVCYEQFEKERNNIDINEKLDLYVSAISCERFFDGQVKGAEYAIEIIQKELNNN